MHQKQKGGSTLGNYSYSIASVEKVIKIIEILAAIPQGLRVSQIAEKLDSHPSSVDRYLITLQNLGYTKKDQNNRYHLTEKIFIIANQMLIHHPITKKYVDLMHTMAYKYGMTTHLSVFFGFYNIILHKETLVQNLDINYAFFDPKRHHYCSAPGKLLLSTLSEEDLQKYFERTTFVKFNKTTLTTEESIRKELQKIRKKGFSIHNEEFLLGNFTISFLIQIDGTTKGAFSFMCPIAEKAKIYNPQTLQEIKSQLGQVSLS